MKQVLAETKTSLKSIQVNKNIIIKDANKENAVVIVDKSYYRTKIQEIQSDKTNPRLMDTNIDNKSYKKLQNSTKHTIKH